MKKEVILKNNMFRLYRELIWNLTDTHIEVFCNK